jgi:hypothetical protein
METLSCSEHPVSEYRLRAALILISPYKTSRKLEMALAFAKKKLDNEDYHCRWAQYARTKYLKEGSRESGWLLELQNDKNGTGG